MNGMWEDSLSASLQHLSPTAQRLGELVNLYRQGKVTNEQRLAAKMVLFGGGMMTASSFTMENTRPRPSPPLAKALHFATPRPTTAVVRSPLCSPDRDAETVRADIDPACAPTVRKSVREPESPWTPGEAYRTPSEKHATYLGFTPDMGSGRRAQRVYSLRRSRFALTPATDRKKQLQRTPSDDASYDSPFSCMKPESAREEEEDSPFACAARTRGTATARLLCSSPPRSRASPCPPPPSPQQIAEVAAVNRNALSLSLNERIALARRKIDGAAAAEAEARRPRGPVAACPPPRGASFRKETCGHLCRGNRQSLFYNRHRCNIACK